MAEKGDGGASAVAPSMSMRMLLATVRRTFPAVNHIETQTLQQWLDEDKQASEGAGDKSTKSAVVILDTRPDYEYEISHIPGATRVNPDLSDVQQIHDSLAEKHSDCAEVKVACYCSVGYRSSKYADALQKYIGTHPESPLSASLRPYNIEGSLFKWANEGRHMVDVNQQATPYAHPYSAIWGKLLRSDLRKWAMDPPASSEQ